MMNNQMKKNPNSKKGGIAEEIEKLKQRREERKNKNVEGESNSKQCDAGYENLMKKKKVQLNIEPENVCLIYFFKNIN
jgi:hypothetical protein